MSINTAGELRGFLADVLEGIRNGTIDTEEAKAISGVASEITKSLAVEVNTALQLQRMGKEAPTAGTMLIADRTGSTAHLDAKPGTVWCDQCEIRVAKEDAAACKSKHCKAKEG